MKHFLEIKADTKNEIDYVISNDITFLSLISE